ncbi:integrase, catalytic region, zinc finger, CCHC-type containing protein [Tanacetum coccineum]
MSYRIRKDLNTYIKSSTMSWKIGRHALKRRTNLSTFMSTFSTIPLEYWIDLSASSKLILVAFGSPKPSFSYIVYDIKLILAPSLFNNTAEHLSFIVIVQASSSFPRTFSVEPLLFLFSIFKEKEWVTFVQHLMAEQQNGYAVLDRKLDTPYPMEVDTPSGEKGRSCISKSVDTGEVFRAFLGCGGEHSLVGHERRGPVRGKFIPQVISAVGKVVAGQASRERRGRGVRGWGSGGMGVGCGVGAKEGVVGGAGCSGGREVGGGGERRLGRLREACEQGGGAGSAWVVGTGGAVVGGETVWWERGGDVLVRGGGGVDLGKRCGLGGDVGGGAGCSWGSVSWGKCMWEGGGGRVWALYWWGAEGWRDVELGSLGERRVNGCGGAVEASGGVRLGWWGMDRHLLVLVGVGSYGLMGLAAGGGRCGACCGCGLWEGGVDGCSVLVEGDLAVMVGAGVTGCGVASERLKVWGGGVRRLCWRWEGLSGGGGRGWGWAGRSAGYCAWSRGVLPLANLGDVGGGRVWVECGGVGGRESRQRVRESCVEAGRTLRTTSLGTVANVQCYNCSEKGHYARNSPKPRIRDLKYFMKQMLLAKHDAAGVILTDEQNNFLFADASRMEEIKELSANICLMAINKPINIDSDVGPSYDSAFHSEVQTPSTSFVNPLFAKDNQEQKYPTQPKIINKSIGDDQIDSNIIFD